jgi:hypothetical protein
MPYPLFLRLNHYVMSKQTKKKKKKALKRPKKNQVNQPLPVSISLAEILHVF